MADRVVTALVSLLVIVGYVAFGFLLLTGYIQPHVSSDVALTLTGGVFGVLTAGFLTALNYWLGSSVGSRSKDGLIGQLANPPQGTPMPPVPPMPVPVTPVTSAPSAPKKFTGITATIFGQPGDGQDQIAYGDVAPGWPNRPGVALPFRFAGARPQVQVWGPRGTVVCAIVDVGPWNTHDPYWQTGSRPQAENGADATGRHTNGAGIDLTPAAAAAVGIDGKGKVDWAFVDGPARITIPQATSEPPWLTVARAEIGFHELPDNHGIQRYVDLAGYGADGEPWCSIFAGAMLRKAGLDITGANAMARSWITAPCVTKLDAPRLGCLAVFWRGSQSGSEGHVGFYVGEADAGHINVLGGNESEAVRIEPLAVAASTFGLIGYWWPKQVVA